MVNGPSIDLAISYFYGGPSQSLDFFFIAKKVSGSAEIYQSLSLLHLPFNILTVALLNA